MIGTSIIPYIPYLPYSLVIHLVVCHVHLHFHFHLLLHLQQLRPLRSHIIIMREAGVSYVGANEKDSNEITLAHS